MMEFFTKNFTINLNGFSLVLVLFFETILVVTFFIYIINFLNKRLNHKLSVRTGFLGKRLMSLAILFSMLSVILLGSYLYQNQINYSSEAELKVDLDINFEISKLDQLSGKKTVDFMVIPIINGTKWGKDNSNFDVIWTIKPDMITSKFGVETINKFEYNISRTHQSNIQLDLLPGNYKVKVLVTFDQKAYEKEIDVIV